MNNNKKRWEVSDVLVVWCHQESNWERKDFQSFSLSTEL